MANRTTNTPIVPISTGTIKRVRNKQSLTSGSLEQTNPLRGLTLTRAVSLMEATLRGEYAIPQWTLWHIEQSDPDLVALESRRSAALMELDWNVKLADLSAHRAGTKVKTQMDAVLAAEQQEALLEAYNRVMNLTDAIEDMSLAFARGYSICQIEDAGRTLGVYDAWNILRNGLRGDFYFNPEARAVSAKSLPPEYRIAPESHLIYQPRRNIMRIALYKFVRMNLGQKDWDAFIEIYGLPGAFIIMPANVPAEKETQYRDAAADAAEGGSGALPNGSEVKFATEPRGSNPFREHLDYLQQQLVLAGTGGLLTMLSMPTGIGQGASGEHADTFRAIARSEARKISEVFQRQFDARVLAAEFPRQPPLAYFELAANEETNVGEIIDHAVKLRSAGFALDAAELSEKTGYSLTPAPISADAGYPGVLPPAAGSDPSPPARSPEARNRAPASASVLPPAKLAESISATLGIRAELVAPLFARIEALAADGKLSDAELLAELERLAADLPELLTERSIEQVAEIVQQNLAAGLVAGIEDGIEKRKEVIPQ